MAGISDRPAEITSRNGSFTLLFEMVAARYGNAKKLKASL